MQAKLKVNYAEAEKGQVFQVVEMVGKIVTLQINGRKADFGYSEVQITAPTNHDLANLGVELLRMGRKSIDGFREVDVTNHIKQIKIPASKNLMSKAINKTIWS